MDGAHSHGHGSGGMDPTPIVVVGIVGIVLVVVLPVVLAILQTILYILLVSAGIGAAVLIYRLQHRVDPIHAPKARTELPRVAQRQALQPNTTHVTLTTEQYENLVRRIGS